MAKRNTPITEAPPELSARDVRALRDRLRVSQSALATILNVSTELVQAWEGERRVPRGAALRLLEIVKARPDLVLENGETSAPAAGTRRDTPRSNPRSNPRQTSAATPAAASERNAGRRATDRPAPLAPSPASALPHTRTSAASGSVELLLGLASHGVSFVTVGGIAAQLRGASGPTDDLDIVYDRTPANLGRLATFLKGIRTTLRGAPGAIPFAADPRTLAHTAVLALDTQLGPLDLRQRIAGIGDFTASLANSTTVALGGRQIPTLTLDALIVSKRATGRSKDREEVHVLEALRQ